MNPILAGIFAKRPQPGAVKTRLAPVLGLERAACFAAALLDDAVARLCAGDESQVSAELVFAPADERAWFEATYPNVDLRAQVGAGLAERLELWFATVLGPERRQPFAAALGCDAPWTGPARVLEAAELLQAGADVVLGPDLGGGYYLVALAEPVPGLFTEIQMSTRSMFAETCAFVRKRGLELALLEADYDVDDAADWQRLVEDLAAGREGAPAVRAFVMAQEAAGE